MSGAWRRLAVLAAFACLQAAQAAGAGDSDRAAAEALVAKLSLPEKIAQLQNAAPAVPRLQLPAYDWWSEGLHGAARDGYATVFPQAIGLAASWDAGLLQAVGDTVSTEARAHFNAAGAGHDHPRYAGLSIWSPNVNIFRDPRWGRGQETYGEDPFLTGRLAVGFVHGIQGDDPAHPKAIATPKHFAVHSGPEAGRHGFDTDVSPHDLEATYLPAFRAAVTEGRAGSVMCAYNALHGTPVCADGWLLGEVLRKRWGFDGYVVSDCDAVDDMTRFHYYKADNAGSASAALAAGTDLNCGDAYAALADGVRRGAVAESVVDQALVRLLAARHRLGEWGGGDRYAAIGADQVDTEAQRQLALKAAAESLVLLKNEHDTLPLQAGKLRLAVVGPNADALESLEANYHGTARAPVTPLQGLRERFGEQRVGYAQGSAIAAGVPAPIPETALRAGPQAGAPAGLSGEYFDHAGLDGKPALVRIDRRVDFDWDHVAPAPALPAAGYAVRWTGTLLPPGPGDYALAVHVDRCDSCAGHDPVRLYLDGKALIDYAGDAAQLQVPVHFDDSRPHAIRLELIHRGQDQGVRLQWLAPAEAQLAEAARAAAQADAVVAFVGLSPDVEGEELQIQVPGFEGGDRTEIGLPAAQQALLERLAASGKPLVVVLMSGSAVAMPWAKQHADAILAAWYPGEQGGRAIARALAGDDNPAGRLPVTFYASTRDLPPFVSYAMQGRTYRYFAGTPLYPFGHGLSYTHFGYAQPQLSSATLAAGAGLSVGVQVSNQGEREGDEVVQVYLDYPAGLPLAPRHALVGFRRVHLRPGESRRVEFALGARELSAVDAAGDRAVVPGNYRLFIGGGQPGDAAGVQAEFSIAGTRALPH